MALPLVLAIASRARDIDKEIEVKVEGIHILHDRICGPSLQDANGFPRVPRGYVLVCTTGKHEADIICKLHMKSAPVYNQRGGVHQVRQE
jgi:hypothetical protein